MSDKKNTTEKHLRVCLFLSLLIYAVAGYIMTLLLDYIFSKSNNGILGWFYLRIDVFFILYLVIGFVYIFE